jgi:hypothetical protein
MISTLGKLGSDLLGEAFAPNASGGAKKASCDQGQEASKRPSSLREARWYASS